VPIALPPPVAFVLSGGGPFGAIQVGMLEAVSEAGIAPDLVVGASAGAINGALVAMDPSGAGERLRGIWDQLDGRQLFPGHPWRRVLTMRRHPLALYSPAGLDATLRRHAGALRIEDLPVRFAAVAVDATSGEPVLLTDGPLLTALRASSAIPAVYPPVERDGRLLYDGGIAGNVPLQWAFELGAGSVVVFDCRLASMPVRAPRTAWQALAFGLGVMITRQARVELDTVSARVPVVYLPGPRGGQGSIFDFSRTEAFRASAYAQTRAFLGGLRVDGPGLYGDPQPGEPSVPPHRRRVRRQRARTNSASSTQ
jgi:NTE family protein